MDVQTAFREEAGGEHSTCPLHQQGSERVTYIYKLPLPSRFLRQHSCQHLRRHVMCMQLVELAPRRWP
jgi:hypothetical protein